MDESGKAFYTQTLTRLTPELQWDKKVYDKINIPQLDTSIMTMNEDYVTMWKRNTLGRQSLMSSSPRQDSMRSNQLIGSITTTTTTTTTITRSRDKFLQILT
eukprot:17174-Amphidinium_carterae.4